MTAQPPAGPAGPSSASGVEDGDEDGVSVWAMSDLAPDQATYITTVHAGDHIRALDDDEADAYVAALMAAMVRAEHDAAVYRQLRALGVDAQDAGLSVADLRADRPPLNPAATAPLAFEPGVSKKGRPFLTVRAAGKIIGYWDSADAHRHSVGVLSARAATPLDAAYRRQLAAMGIEPARARAVVAGLANFMPGGPGTLSGADDRPDEES